MRAMMGIGFLSFLLNIAWYVFIVYALYQIMQSLRRIAFLLEKDRNHPID